jgi:hypothetical protein
MGTSIFLGFYIAICAALYLLTIFANIASDGRSSFSSSMSFSAVIFAFVYVIADYKSKTNYLMMFGNTRKNIFLSSLSSNIALSVLLTIISTIFTIIENTLAALFYKSGNNMNLFHAIYPESNIGTEMLYMCALFILITSFSTFYAALAYKIGTIFKIVFWVVFGMSFMFFPFSPVAGNLLKAFFCYSAPNGILLAPFNFMIASLILYAISYAAAIRQPQVV